MRIPIDQVMLHRNNPRLGDVGAISESLRVNGQYRPIVVRAETMECVAGNHTLAAARALGWTDIDVVVVNIDDEEARRILAVDNRSFALGANDDDALVALLSALPGLEGTGYDPEDLDDLLAGLGTYQGDPGRPSAPTSPSGLVLCRLGPWSWQVTTAELAIWLAGLGGHPEVELRRRLGLADGGPVT